MPPVFVAQYSGFLRRFAARVRTLQRGLPVETKAEAVTYFVKMRTLAETLEAELGALGPPGEVLDQTLAHKDALYKLGLAADAMARAVRRAPDLDPPPAGRPYRRLRKAAARELRTRNALTRALGGDTRRKHRAPAPPSSEES